MALQETHIYIARSADEVVSSSGLEASSVRYGEEKLVLFGAATRETAPHALLEDDEDQGQWCTLLAQEPNDAGSVARALIELKIDPELLRCSTSWDNVPLIDLEAVKAAMLVDAQRGV